MYPTSDTQRTGEPFSRAFEDFYRSCLQKNPQLRPSAEELLQCKFFRNRSSYALVNQLLGQIPSVGVGTPVSSTGGGSTGVVEGRVGVDEDDEETVVGNRMLGTRPFTIEMQLKSNVGGVEGVGKSTNSDAVGAIVGEEKPKYVPGTTWVFDDSDELPRGGSTGSIGNRVLMGGAGSGTLRVASVVPTVVASSSGGVEGRAENRRSKEADIDSFLNDFETETATMVMPPSTNSPQPTSTNNNFNNIAVAVTVPLNSRPLEER